MATATSTLDAVEEHAPADPKPTPRAEENGLNPDIPNTSLRPEIRAFAGPAERSSHIGRAQTCATSDSIVPEPCAAGTGTPPIDIILPLAQEKARSDTCHRASCGLNVGPENQRVMQKPCAGNQSRRKNKRHLRKGNDVALNTVLGFTPTTSEDERSDVSKRNMRGREGITKSTLGSLATSTGYRSSSPGPGVSALTQQLEALQCASRPSDHHGQFKATSLRIETNSECAISSYSTVASASLDPSPTASHSSATSESMRDGAGNQTVSYEVALEHDFVSPDIAGKDCQGLGEPCSLDYIAHKMTASDFDPLRCLGKGTYGTVLLVKQAGTGRLFAQKQFRKASLTVKQQLIEQTKTERAILESINRHPYVVKLFYAFQDQEKLYLILEYAQGGELFTRMLTEGMFPEETAAFYMAEMVLALDHLHNTVGVVYRDLKPENCLLDADGHLLLTDFGLSKVAVDGDYRCRSMTGTLEYMAPEVLQQQSYGPEIDWWSFAVLGYEMLAGASPFHAKNDAKIQEKILKSKLVLPFFMSADAKDLLTRLLRKKPKERLGARMPKDLGLIKGHRFFRKIDWKKLEKRQLEPPFKPIITDPEMAENFSTEFTDLALSPVSRHPKHDWGFDSAADLFQGFSFVASRSLLNAHDGFF